MEQTTPDTAATPASPSPRGSGAEKTILLVVLMIVGGALGYAAYLASGGRPVPVEVAGDVSVISRGEPVDLEASVVAGKYTVFDFYADWCPPCRVLDVQLHQIAAHHDNIAIRKIDIIDWTTPVVRQHDVQGLPHLILFGPDGRKMASGEDVYRLLSQIFDTPVY